jgi:hypothetical protein
LSTKNRILFAEGKISDISDIQAGDVIAKIKELLTQNS